MSAAEKHERRILPAAVEIPHDTTTASIEIPTTVAICTTAVLRHNSPGNGHVKFTFSSFTEGCALVNTTMWGAHFLLN